MKVDYQKIRSEHLGEDFEFKVYGHAGKPVMVFPCSEGRFFDYEDRGMVHALHDFIQRGEIRLFAVDSRDSRSWFRHPKNEEMGKEHRKYELCISEEIIPYIAENFHVDEKFIATGNSWGAYHSLNFCLKFPGLFDTALCFSGNYSLQGVIGSYYDTSVYYNDILSYLPHLTEPIILEELRKHYVVICHGTGAWEISNHEASAASQMLEAKKIPSWYDVWGEEYPHDWDSWREQVPYFFGHLRDGVLMPDGIRKIIGSKRRRSPLMLPSSED